MEIVDLKVKMEVDIEIHTTKHYGQPYGRTNIHKDIVEHRNTCTLLKSSIGRGKSERKQNEETKFICVFFANVSTTLFLAKTN